jgi:DNA-binding response OmpR family regulator
MATVLLIEDNPDVRRTLCRALERAGHDVLEARDGVAGVDLFTRNRVDLVITDLVMPRQRGPETIEQIREVHTTVPIIAISGSHRSDEEFERAAQLGANLCLTKPFGVDELLRAVQEVLRQGGESAPAAG